MCPSDSDIVVADAADNDDNDHDDDDDHDHDDDDDDDDDNIELRRLRAGVAAPTTQERTPRTAATFPTRCIEIHHSAVQPGTFPIHCCAFQCSPTCYLSFLHTCMICASKRLHINTQMAINIF